MKRTFLILTVATTMFAAMQISSCKGKENKTNTEATVSTRDTQPSPAPTPPVAISVDEQLTKDVKDATKDFPGVTASVNGGEITLTGDITRDKLQQLMMSVNALHAKKVNNNLTIKK